MRAERGSAVVGFVLVVGPVLALLLATVQAVAYLRLHGIVAAAAAEGARWGAAAGRSTGDGAVVAEGVLARSPAAGRVRCTAGRETAGGGVVLVVVRCSGTVPAVLPAADLDLRATARAVAEDR